MSLSGHTYRKLNIIHKDLFYNRSRGSHVTEVDVVFPLFVYEWALERWWLFRWLWLLRLTPSLCISPAAVTGSSWSPWQRWYPRPAWTAWTSWPSWTPWPWRSKLFIYSFFWRFLNLFRSSMTSSEPKLETKVTWLVCSSLIGQLCRHISLLMSATATSSVVVRQTKNTQQNSHIQASVPVQFC